MIIDFDGIPHIVRQLEAKSPSARGAATLYKVRFNNLQTHQKLDASFKGDDILKNADCIRVGVQYSYRDGDSYFFMNQQDFSLYEINAEQLQEQIPYLVEQQEVIIALLMDGNLLAIELPQSVTLEILETPPAISGASATHRSKAATLVTGLEVQVPEYIASGELVRINTITGKFMSRSQPR
ncbi:MAG: elongation factor P-like protein YeiP [Gammaproteobacteria bacterium]|nr:elongation factor P-like protein YeiP [Gammaproteobacteria bacterium]MCY4358819.1 elongation factor P-like protein YeiP [Gammaproteobacteria bacterium]